MNTHLPAAILKNSKVLIIIPARYQSTRLPGKPLLQIAGKTMLSRVWAIAQTVCLRYQHHANLSVAAFVTTEDDRILDYCTQLQIPTIQTSADCRSGTERVAQACAGLNCDFVLNLQGDNALCPPWFLEAIIEHYLQQTNPTIITPYVQLTWTQFDQLRREKQQTPFSGTSVVMNNQGQAFWFSKNIIPAIRDEQKSRTESKHSPVARHIGLYGYTMPILQHILDLPESTYEKHEGLEQLSFLEAGIPIQMVQVDYGQRQGMTGIDSPEDVQRAEQIIQQDGELIT